MKALYAVHQKEGSNNKGGADGAGNDGALGWRPAFLDKMNAPAAGEGGGASSVLMADYSVSSHVPKEGTVTFDAVFIKAIKESAYTSGKSVSLIVVPFGVGETFLRDYPQDVPHITIPAGPGETAPQRKPLIEPVSADGQAVRVLYKLLKTAATEEKSKKKKTVKFVPVAGARDFNSSSIIANAAPMLVSLFVASGQNFEPPAPGTIVRVIDFCLGTDATGERCYMNIDGISTKHHADLNQLSETDRLAAVFPAEKQTLASLATLLPLRDVMARVSENGLDRNVFNKARNQAARDAGAPVVPFVRAEQVQAWTLGDAPLDPFSAPPLLPIRGFPADPEKGGVFLYSLENSRSIYLVDDKNVKKMRLEMNFLAVSEGKRMCLHQATVWPRSFATLGITYPTFIEAFLRQHPVPFQLFYGIDFAQTLMIPDNQPGQRPNAFPDGIVKPDVQMLLFRTEEYAERQGIPVPLSLVRARFGLREGNPSLKPRYHEDKPPASSVAIKDFFSLPENLRLENSYGTMKTFDETGFAALDCGEFELPTEATDDVVFYALSSIPLNGDIRRAPRADPFVDDPAEDLPLAVDMTPAEGEMLIVKNCPNEKLPTDLRAWTVDNGRGPVPRFFFFMQRKRTPDEIAQRVHLFKKTHAIMCKPFPNLVNIGLPATMEAWRSAVMTNSNEKDEPAAPAPVDVASKKRPFADDGSSAALEPETKYARTSGDI